MTVANNRAEKTMFVMMPTRGNSFMIFSAPFMAGQLTGTELVVPKLAAIMQSYEFALLLPVGIAGIEERICTANVLSCFVPAGMATAPQESVFVVRSSLPLPPSTRLEYSRVSAKLTDKGT